MGLYIYVILFVDNTDPSKTYIHDKYFGSMDEARAFLKDCGYLPSEGKYSSCFYDDNLRAYVEKVYRD